MPLPPSEPELDRASHLVKNGLCFNLEASSQVAGLAGSQALWNRQQPLLKPLKNISYWTASKLRDEIFTQLQPDSIIT